MSQANLNQCCCPSTEVVEIPGSPGTDGAAGTAGAPAFSVLVQATFQTTGFGAVTITGSSNIWVAIGEYIFVSDQGTKWGTMKVTALPAGGTQITGIWQNFSGEQTAGSITTGIITPSGPPFAVGALPTAFTDNTGGVASNTMATGVGVSTLTFWVDLTTLTNADILTAYTVGYAFKILSVAFGVHKAVTTGAKLATITPSITGVATTGGILSLTSANCTPKGVVVPASAVTGTNSGSASDTISLTASAVTAFIEGNGWIIIEIKNMDAANAFASISAHTNTLIAAL